MAAMTEKEKRDHIITSIKENMFVEAGAGAGKTTLIVNRIVEQISHGIRPKEIAAITYTNKAAEELRTRIQTSLIKEAKGNKEISAVLDEVDSMPISTIHSFCLNILREHAFEAGIRPDAEVYEEGRLKAEMQMFFRRYFKNISPKQIALMKYYKIAAEPSYHNNDNPLYKLFHDICELPPNAAVPYDKTAADNLTEDSAEIKKQFDAAAAEIISLYNREFNKSISRLSDIKDILYSKLTDNSVELLMKLKEIADRKGVFTQRPPKGSLTNKAKALELNDKYMKWFEKNAGKFLAERELRISNFMTSVAYPASSEFRRRERSNLITNNELIRITEELIRTNKTVREHYAAKLKCIYVDEFQDTDYFQASLIWQLAYDDEKKALRDGALFIVGDPKQSIYRFTGADPQVYHDIKSKPELKGHIYVLDSNFRSSPKIIDWVNSKFSDNGTFRKNGFAYSNMAVGVPLLTASKDTVLEGVYYCKTYSKGKVSKTAELTIAAEDTAKLIDELVNKQIKIPNRRKTENCRDDYRLVEYGDFLILFSKNKHIPVYADALRSRNIPVSIAGQVPLNSSAAVKRFLLLYNYCVRASKQPLDKGAVQLTFENADNITDEMTAFGMETIKAVRERTKGMKDGFAVALFLIRNIQYYLPADTDLTADTTLRIAESLEQLLSDMLLKCRGNRIEAADMFAQTIKKGFEKNMPLVRDNSSVRLMTAHKAKGLEGSIVIWANRSTDVREDKSYRKYGNPVTYYANVNINSTLKDEREKLDIAERTRLEYVIATRAKEAFIVMDRLVDDNGLLNDYGIDKCPDVKDVISKVTASAPANTVTFPEYTPDISEQTYSDEQLDTSFVTLNPSGFDNYNAVISDDADEPDEPEIISAQADAERPKGAVFGTALHRCYELLVNEWKLNFDMTGDEMKELIRKCVYTAIMEAGMTVSFDEASGFDEELTRVMNWFVNEKSFTEILRDSAEIFTELPFSYFIGAEEAAEMLEELSKYKQNLNVSGKKIWVNGVSDLVVKGKDGSITVIDYKSDIDKQRKPEKFYDRLKARYEGQLTLYRYAMGKIFGVSPDSVKTLLCNIDAGSPLVNVESGK
ncbi:MAG: UvrD-helicase domain-containing protein [Oscillospiraceae bacterium]|nr:UvrD-helicase domain-containing protein [Oscillospiraceae bacterium]